MPSSTQTALQFERFTLDIARGRLCAEDEDIKLRPKSFDVLRYLVENADRLVTKDELVRAVWDKVVVTDESLTRCMSDVRLALGDADQRIIKTVPRRGYMFAAKVSKPVASTAALPLPDRPSIAVVPFTNRSGDAQQDYFADGISEDSHHQPFEIRWPVRHRAPFRLPLPGHGPRRAANRARARGTLSARG
jgi:adenylate cyclase